MKFRSVALLAVASMLTISMMPVAAQDNPFPVSVEHQYGTTVIETAPQRVVALGYTEQDFLLSLGVTPVAVRYWYGEEDAIMPWAEDYVEGERPVVLNMPFNNLSYEAILALQPDLISAVTAGLSAEEYELLSQIAPTISQSGDYINFGMPWQEAQLLIGQALGKGEEAAEIVANVESQFADALTANPELEGKTVAVTYYSEGTFGFYTDQDARGRFFTDLGFVVPEEMVEIAGESFYANLSTERLDLLDQDLIAILNLQFVEGGRETIESDPLFSQLSAVQESRILYFDEVAENALGFSTPLSLPYALEAVLPEIENMYADPADASTETVACEAGFRWFEHQYLGSDPLCIPEAPERIAVLDLSPLEVALIQGIEPVAMYGYGRDLIVRSNPNLTIDVTGLTANTADVGNAATVNLEALLASDPDLIIASAFTATSAGLDTLQAIAPTVIYSYPLEVSEYRSSVEFVADVLNTPEVADELLGQLDARLADFRALMADTPTNVSLVRLRDTLVLFVSGSFGDTLIHEAGLTRPEQQQAYDLDFVINENDSWVGFDVSEENLPLIDAENIFIWTASSTSVQIEEEARAVIATLQENPLWNTLSGVQNEHLFVVGSHWQGFGIFEAHAALDDLFRYIAGVDPQEVSPNPFFTAE